MKIIHKNYVKPTIVNFSEMKLGDTGKIVRWEVPNCPDLKGLTVESKMAYNEVISISGESVPGRGDMWYRCWERLTHPDLFHPHFPGIKILLYNR